MAVVNASGVEGLGSDVADFLSNVGMDVVAVKTSESEPVGTSTVLVASSDRARSTRIASLFADWFGWEGVEMGDTSGWRSEVVVTVGGETKELF